MSAGSRRARHTERDDGTQYRWKIHNPQGRRRSRAPQVSALVAVVLTLAAGLAVATSGVVVGAVGPVAALALPTATVPQAAVPRAAASQAAASQPAASQPAASQPAVARLPATRLRIPSIGVDTALVPIDVDGAGVLVPPSGTDVAGWFVQGAAPAQPGPAVVAGHIDSYRGPGVFFRLHDVTVGAVVEVDTPAGPPVRYQVVDVTTLLKSDFPTQQVYGPTPAPELRLITCGGSFDRTDRRYLSNVIVSAVLV